MDCTYKIQVLGRDICFVDRDDEVNKILELMGRNYPFPVVLYGPEGCGKSTLLKYVAEKLRRRGDTFILYIDALENIDIGRAVISNINAENIREIISSIVVNLPLGKLLSMGVSYIISEVHRRYALSGKYLVIMVDDVYKAIGLDDADRYSKHMYELIESIYRHQGVKSVLIILATSEGISKRELGKHTYVHLYLMWNLPRSGFTELAHQLNAPLDVDELWRLTGGSPRALIDLAAIGWDANEWLRRLSGEVKAAINGLNKERLRSLVKDPDSDWEMAKILENYNLMIELRRALTIGKAPNPDPELGIGNDWAWQLPAYKLLVEEYTK